MIQVKILSYKSPQRYAVRRTLMAAFRELKNTSPEEELAITEVSDLSEMHKYTAVIILPSLVVNDKLVCVGRFPKKEEVLGWLQEALEVSL